MRRTPGHIVWWKRTLTAAGVVVCLLLLGISTFIGALILQYNRIISAKPGPLQTQPRPREFGRWVNPFIGTGGVPWVCANNSPAAMVPFGMVRVGPETASILVGKRALNSSGYYYGDAQILGFSHTRLNGTGATDGGHFLVMPSRKPVGLKNPREPISTRFSHSGEAASPGLRRQPAST